jgi:hypothetical protein
MKTHQDIGLDEEAEIIGFTYLDLCKFTRALITEAACLVKDPKDRNLILERLGN